MKVFFLVFYNFFENFIHLKRIRKFLKNSIFLKRPIIFDVGAHQGKMSKLFNQIYFGARIFCFEPNTLFHNKLKKIGKNTAVYNYAIGKKVEKKFLYLSNIDLTSTLSKVDQKSLYLKFKKYILGKSKLSLSKKVSVMTLNQFCKNKKIKKIDLLKIDVEGYEHMVLLGSSKIIKNVSYIMIEIQKNDMYLDYSRKKIEKFLRKNNFKLIKKFNFPFMFFQDCIYKNTNLRFKINN